MQRLHLGEGSYRCIAAVPVSLETRHVDGELTGGTRRWGNQIWAGIFGWFLTLLFTLLFPCGTAADTVTGLQWLTSRAAADGSYTPPGDLATPLQSTAEVLRAFYALGNVPTTAPASRQYIDAEPFEGMEYIARRTISSS